VIRTAAKQRQGSRRFGQEKGEKIGRRPLIGVEGRAEDAKHVSALGFHTHNPFVLLFPFLFVLVLSLSF
jgi:hypothetical protein